jgi:hypothetical protein
MSCRNAVRTVEGDDERRRNARAFRKDEQEAARGL